MVSSFLRRLFAPAPTFLSEPDGRTALAALMVRIAKADSAYTPDEVHQIDTILTARYGLSPREAAEVRAAGEEMEADAADTVRFTRALKDAVPFEERLALIETLWSVALSDGSREAEEDALLRLIAPLLGVSDQESAFARQRATAALNL